MDFTGWFSKIDPSFVVGLVVAGAGYVWKQLRGDKHASIVDIAEGLARQAVQLYASEPDAASKAATKIEAFVISGLAARLGVDAKQLEKYEPLVHPVIEHAIADLLELINKQNTEAAATLPAKVAALSDQIAQIPAAIDAAQKAGLAAVKDLADQTVEKVP